MFVAVDLDRVGGDAVGALPDPRIPLVTSAVAAGAVARFHLARLRVHRSIAGEHAGVAFLVLIGHAVGNDIAFGQKIVGALIQPDMVGCGGAGGVGNGRLAVERHHVLLLVERRLLGVSFAIAFLIGKITGLLHGGQLVGLRLKARRQLLAGSGGGGAIVFLFLHVGVGGSGDVAGAEAFDVVLRGVRDQHLVALQGAMVRGRLVGQKFQRARGVRRHRLDVAASGTHLHVDVLRAQHVRIGGSLAGRGERPRCQHGIAGADRMVELALLVVLIEVHLHVVGGHLRL